MINPRNVLYTSEDATCTLVIVSGGVWQGRLTVVGGPLSYIPDSMRVAPSIHPIH